MARRHFHNRGVLGVAADRQEYRMGNLFRISMLCLVLFLFAGCASDGTVVNPFASSESSADSGTGYFFSDFPDIPIPNGMSESRSDTFTTIAPTGVKCGTQRFSGRLEVVSLMNTMRRNMAANGWALRSLLRAKESTLVFDKTDRVATFQISDGLIFTEMRLFVSARLEGDTSSVPINAYPPSSGGTPQKLEQ